MEKVRPWCGQLSDQGRLKNRTELQIAGRAYYKKYNNSMFAIFLNLFLDDQHTGYHDLLTPSKAFLTLHYSNSKYCWYKMYGW